MPHGSLGAQAQPPDELHGLNQLFNSDLGESFEAEKEEKDSRPVAAHTAGIAEHAKAGVQDPAIILYMAQDPEIRVKHAAVLLDLPHRGKRSILDRAVILDPAEQAEIATQYPAIITEIAHGPEVVVLDSPVRLDISGGVEVAALDSLPMDRN